MRDNLKTPNRRATGLKLLFVLFLLVPGFTSSYAQLIIPPGTTEGSFTGAISPGVINNALLDYHCNGGGQLMAVTWGESFLGHVYCVISDGHTSMPVVINLPAGYTTFEQPDVILGGDNGALSTTFYIGIVYEADGSSNTDIYLQVATITDPGSGSFTSSSSCSSILLNSPSGLNNSVPHIDVIAKDMGHGVVNADNFVVSWNAIDNVIPTRNVVGLYCSGLAAVAGSCSVLSTPVNIASGVGQADVAGIERQVGVGIVDDIALFTYTDMTGGVYYQEWDVTTTPSSATPVYSAIGPLLPRIDAVDCYSQHSPVVTGIANFDIVFPSVNLLTATTNIISVNDLAGAYNCSNGSFNSVFSLLPQVACGPGVLGIPGTYQYDIVYSATNPFSPTDSNIYSQLINWNTGNLAPSNIVYRQVNMNTGVSLGASAAISSAVNNLVPDNVFACWYNGSSGTIDYKISGSPVVYKSTSVNSISTATNWQLSPNPASDYIYLSCPSTDITGTTYSITDITGRVMQQRDVTSARQQVAVNDLPSGMYMMNVETSPGPSKGGEQHVKTIKFVKE